MFLLAISTGLWPSLASGATVHAQNDDNRSPFPNDRFTVTDVSHNSRLRVNLPKPDCTVRRSDCEDVDVINTLDGFSLQSRLSIPFDGPIDVGTVTSDTVFVLKLGSTLVPPIHWQRRIIGINRVLWDPATLTLFAEPDEVLEQHTRYAIVVTRDVRDRDGNPVAAAPGFERVKVAGKKVAVTSVFTTRSVTAFLEKVRDRVKASTPDPADFLLAPGRARTVFSLRDIQQITVSRQIGTNPARFAVSPVTLDPLNLVPGTVGQIAFGRFTAPDYLTHPGEFIDPFGTATGTPRERGMQDLYFNVYLPAGREPLTGWPVAIIGHGANGTKEGATASALDVAAVLAEHGIASIGINHLGLGGGPLGTISVTTRSGASVTFSAGGRGIDQNGDTTIAAREGDAATAPRASLLFTPGIMQTAADLMQLVRVIQMGVDFDGDMRSDLDPRRIHFVGNSLGGALGVVFAAVEPDIRTAVFINPAGPVAENNRLSPLQRVNVAARLASRVPSLINTPGITSVGGIAVGPPFFDENKPARNQPAVINTVPGAMDIQVVLEWMDWITQPANPVAYIRHLQLAPLGGAASKPILYYFGKGDQDIPNMNTSETLVAGGLVNQAIYYGHDLAFAENPAALPKDPHAFAFGFRTGRLDLAPVAAVARASQQQFAVFMESFGSLIVPAQPVRFFESPIRLPLPGGFNYIP